MPETLAAVRVESVGRGLPGELVDVMVAGITIAVPWENVIELTYEYEQPLAFTSAANARRPVGPWEDWSGLPEDMLQEGKD